MNSVWRVGFAPRDAEQLSALSLSPPMGQVRSAGLGSTERSFWTFSPTLFLVPQAAPENSTPVEAEPSQWAWVQFSHLPGAAAAEW